MPWAYDCHAFAWTHHTRALVLTWRCAALSVVASARAVGADGFVYVPHEDGRIYSIKDADSDGTISAGEVDWFDTKMGFQGSPAIAPDVLAIAPCDGMAVFMTPEGQLRAKQSRRS